MKNIYITIAAFLISASAAVANEIDYQCVADRLQAINSDIFYGLTRTDIDAMLQIPEMAGHIEALKAVKYCENNKNTQAANLPCNGNQEAQFIANYNHVDYSYAEAGNLEHTTFDLRDFRFFKPNGTCPLDMSQAMNAVITVPGMVTSIHSGAEVSGVLVYNPKFNMYSIE